MISTPVVVTWLFATWWFFGAIRDCTNPKSKRYGNPISILLALVAAGTLGWLGLSLLSGAQTQVAIGLIGFGVSFILWVVASLAGGRRQ